MHQYQLKKKEIERPEKESPKYVGYKECYVF